LNTGCEELPDASLSIATGQDQLHKKLRQHLVVPPILSGDDVDAAWEDADVGKSQWAAVIRRRIKALCRN